LGYSVNIPVPEESGDDIFSEGLAEIISIGKQFNPDVVGISAGFDGHINDPLLNLRLSVNSYYSAGKIIRQTFPRIFATLEGGYNPADLPGCLFGFLAGVNDEKLTYIEERTETAILKLEEFSVRINDLRKNMQPYWKL
jgi:acetoin utilization deacetylase AcuC-like enzyme